MKIAQTRTLFGGSKLAASALALSAAAVVTVGLVTSAFAASNVVVTPTDTQGWVNGDVRPGGSVGFTEDYGAPDGYGVGSLELVTTDSVAKAQYKKTLDAPVPLSEVDDVAYSTFRAEATTGSDVQAPAVNLVVDYNGDAEGGFATLVFEPVYNTDQGAIVGGE